jgi:L-ascorbate metabolism protein UlaG (beta-lactamase superfamily)
MKRSLRSLALVAAAMFAALAAAGTAAAQERVSRCLAIAGNAPPVVPASLEVQVLSEDQVRISYVTHSTFRIESPAGLIIATDYAGYAGDGRLPDVVTMNHAHSTHYTNYPDPDIPHVLRGWNPDGGAANHHVTIEDVMIRNVPTDIRSWGGVREVDGNSIFIFETAGLCIGHLGHLHHELGAQHLGWIGRLDVVMVPVDGSYTMAQSAMIQVLRDLQSAVVIPMHFFSQTALAAFIDKMGAAFEVRISESPSIVVSEKTLPRKPTLVVLPGF